MPRPSRSTAPTIPGNPELSAERVDQLERTLIALLDLRIRGNESEFNDAVTTGRWSQVSGLHGIGTGLLIAKRLVDEEFQSLRRNAAKSEGVAA